MAFNYKGDDLYVSGITFSNNSDKMLVRTKSEKFGDIPIRQLFYLRYYQ